jgi:hypothetical protein
MIGFRRDKHFPPLPYSIFGKFSGRRQKGSPFLAAASVKFSLGAA